MGLRQGDPLSPMRFILVMDVLNSLVLKAELGLLQPLLSGGRGSHYMQTVWCLFMQPRDNELLLVKKKKKLNFFGEVTGLVINMRKVPLPQLDVRRSRLRLYNRF